MNTFNIKEFYETIKKHKNVLIDLHTFTEILKSSWQDHFLMNTDYVLLGSGNYVVTTDGNTKIFLNPGLEKIEYQFSDNEQDFYYKHLCDLNRKKYNSKFIT